MKKSNWLCSICFVIFVCSALCVYGQEKTISNLGQIFQDIGINFSRLADYTVEKNNVRVGNKNTFRTVVARKGHTHVRLEIVRNIARDDAVRYAEERLYVIRALYAKHESPYPGMISQVIECPDELKPRSVAVSIGGDLLPVLLAASTARFTYGASAEDLITYRGGVSFIYNEARQVLCKVEVFVEKKSFDQNEVLDIFRSVIVTDDHAEVIGTPFSVVSSAGDEPEAYNVIIIGYDPLGANHVSACGYERDTTPNLVRFTRDAFRFNNAISPSSWTLPVFMSWFTSLYPSQHTLTNKYDLSSENQSETVKLPADIITFAQLLKGQGYATAGFTGDAGVSAEFGYDRGFDEYYDDTPFGGFDIVLPKALAWLQQHKEEKFFLFVQAYDVHGRHEGVTRNNAHFVQDSYAGKYAGTSDEYWALRNLSVDGLPIEMSSDDMQFWRDWYDSKIYEADKKFGSFVDACKAMKIFDNTIVLISSASGNEFFEHGTIDHGYSVYDELIKVPLFIKIPQRAGDTITQQVRTLDIMPTLLDVMHIEYDEGVERQMQGVSLLGTMQGQDVPLTAFSETDYLLQTFKRSVRTPDGWKYIYSMDNDMRELYNLTNDPGELHNMIDEDQRMAYALEQKLFNHLTSLKQKR